MACYGEGTGHCGCRDCREDEIRAKVSDLVEYEDEDAKQP